jgi:Tol biopolymer transport system component
MKLSKNVPAFLLMLYTFQGGASHGAEPRKDRRETYITFVSHRTGDNLLYRMRPDGSDCNPIFGGTIKDAPGIDDDFNLYREPHWTWQSPDGKYFSSWAYDSLRPKNKVRALSSSPPGPMFRMILGRSDGSGPVRILTPECDEAVAWSPDSRRIAYGVFSEQRSTSAYPNPARMTRIYVVAINATSEELIFEQPGVWRPMDWSIDGKKLLMIRSEILSTNFMLSDIVEIDMAKIEKIQQNPGRENPTKWQNHVTRFLIEPVLGDAATIKPEYARYSPDGKSIAVMGIHKEDKPVNWKPLDFELGIIDRGSSTYRKIAHYEAGLRGPLCWSPDGTEIVFSRPLEKGDDREKWDEEGSNGLELWLIKSDGTDARPLTTGWSPDWR